MDRERMRAGAWSAQRRSLAIGWRHPILLTLALALFMVAGCGSGQPMQTELVTPKGVAAEIIPREGDPTAYGLAISLSNTQRFIDYYNSITLTSGQEKVKHDALTPLKAPCCDDNSMYEC